MSARPRSSATAATLLQAVKTEAEAADVKTEVKTEEKPAVGGDPASDADPPEDKQQVPTYSSEAAQPTGPVVGPTGEFTETIMIPSSEPHTTFPKTISDCSAPHIQWLTMIYRPHIQIAITVVTHPCK